MLKRSLLIAALAFSSSASAYDQADREARLGRLVDQPGQAALIQYAPQIVYVPVPVPAPASTPAPVECEQPVVDEPTTIYVQPPQSAALRTSR